MHYISTAYLGTKYVSSSISCNIRLQVIAEVSFLIESLVLKKKKWLQWWLDTIGLIKLNFH